MVDALEAAADGVFGFIDSFLDSINPLNNWISVPDIGPVFGHTEAYGIGQIGGSIAGIAANILIGNVAAGGLVGCGSLLQQSASMYSTVSTAAGVIGATQHVLQGNAGWSDGLAFLPALTWGASKMAGLGGCFEAGTQVVTGQDPDHAGVFSTTKIEDIEVGDWVLSKDEADPDAPLECKQVTAVYQHLVYSTTDVYALNADGTVETIHTTANHRFYVDGVGWTDAGNLLQGEEFITAEGVTVTVMSTVEVAHPEGMVVYNFQVEGDHTYFVREGDADVWVHNQCVDVAAKVRLAKSQYGLTRLEHADEGIRRLQQAISRDANFEAQLQAFVGKAGIKSIMRGKTPKGWDWHHVLKEQASGQAGWLALVRRRDHRFWSSEIFHPDGYGGFKEWVLPARPH